MSKPVEINMSRYCTYNTEAKYWDVSVPIHLSGIQKAHQESLGYFRREEDAHKAVTRYFKFVYQKPCFGGVMARSEADDQRIEALRIRVSSFEAEITSMKGERKFLLNKYKTVCDHYKTLAAQTGGSAWDRASAIIIMQDSSSQDSI